MKKIFLSAFVLAAFSITTQAQAGNAGATPVKASVTKEEKAKQKAQKEQELTEALNALNLSDEQIKQVRETLDAATKKSNALKNNTALTQDEKAAEKERITEEKNNKLQAIMGKEKYSQWNSIRKQQKEKNTAANQ